jgi:hypothetical protein
VPAGVVAGEGRRESLARLIASQSPAHTVPTLRVGGAGFVVGPWSAVGIDTAFVPLPAPVLGGTGNVRLSRASVLYGGRRAGRGMPADGTAQVGLNTVAR